VVLKNRLRIVSLPHPLTGNASRHALLIAVPSFFKRFTSTSSDPTKDVSAKLDQKDHILTVRITDSQTHHELRIQLTS